MAANSDPFSTLSASKEAPPAAAVPAAAAEANAVVEEAALPLIENSAFGSFRVEPAVALKEICYQCRKNKKHGKRIELMHTVELSLLDSLLLL